MPSPPTTNLPRPQLWDEFENICADVLKLVWSDPYVVRYGRSGQKQHSVDIYGQPKHLGGTITHKYAGAQCKVTNKLTISVVEKEVELAKALIPELTEYVFMTTAPRDAKLQDEVRTHSWPFRIQVMCWEDICLELSAHDDLLQKHFPGYMQKATTKEQILNLVLSSQPEEFDYDGETGIFMYSEDVKLRIILDRSDELGMEFDEPWVHNFLYLNARRQLVYIHYGESRILEIACVLVDGGRHIIPFPKSQTELTINRLQYQIGRIVNHLIPGFDLALQRAGITVHE